MEVQGKCRLIRMVIIMIINSIIIIIIIIIIASDHNFDWNYDNFLLKFKGTYLPRVVLLFFFQIPMAEYKEVDFLFPEI